MTNIKDIDLRTVTGGANKKPRAGGDGDSLGRHDMRFPELPDALKGKTKGQG